LDIKIFSSMNNLIRDKIKIVRDETRTLDLKKESLNDKVEMQTNWIKELESQSKGRIDDNQQIAFSRRIGKLELINMAAKLRYMSNGQLAVPLVIRTVTGGGGQLGATHSQRFEGWLASVPGLKVAVPSNSYDALGLLRTAITDENPVVFTEHALLYGDKSDVPNEPYLIPFGESSIKRQGTDLTIIAYSRMVHIALEAAQRLATEGLSAEVIDLRTLRPLDTDTVLQSVRKTNRAVVVEETWKTGGFAAELVSTIQESAFDSLDAPVGRVGGALPYFYVVIRHPQTHTVFPPYPHSIF